MVLLDLVAGKGIFSFRTHIHRLKRPMWIGVTDRVTQKARHWAQWEHSIKYNCCYGKIYYATGDGKYKFHDDGAVADEGVELLCEVEREKCQLNWTVLKKKHGIYRLEVHSPILGHAHREFVPFFEIYSRGESISWELQWWCMHVYYE